MTYFMLLSLVFADGAPTEAIKFQVHDVASCMSLVQRQFTNPPPRIYKGHVLSSFAATCLATFDTKGS